MIWLALALIVIWVLDGVRLRARLARLPVLPPADEPVDDGHRFITAPGVALDEATRRAASAWARAEGLEVVDLVPGDLDTERLLGVLRLVDSDHDRAHPFAPAHSAGHAILVHTDVAERAGIDSASAPDPVVFIRLMRRLKQHAARRTAHALATDLRSVSAHADRNLAVMRESFGPITPWVLLGQIFFLGLLGLAVAGSLTFGLAALAVFHLQPLIVIAGSKARPRRLAGHVLLRSPLRLWAWLRTLTGRWRPDDADPVEARRPIYEALLANGTDRFFEPRRDTCPVCEGSNLEIHLETTDLFQHKPGNFILERCKDCEHIFQNPRLSIEGLDFYYRDFYDGLGERTTDFIFSVSDRVYLERARVIPSSAKPKRWLDVGTGHGHFCMAARSVWPDVQFDGLDLSESIEEAERRGWVDTAYRGQFPELADHLTGYDVVSMSHYLEHTRDPEAEITAAARVLPEDGHLFIEVPDPDSRLKHLLGRFWIPYLQPQHQHLLSVKNLDAHLRRHGFKPVLWREAHRPVDWLMCSIMWLNHLAGITNQPWRPRPTVLSSVRRDLVWLFLGWLVPVAWGLDMLTNRAMRRVGWSNAYRVLAQRDQTRPANSHGPGRPPSPQ